MLGLTNLGVVHTAISLVAVGAAVAALVRHREVAYASGAGRVYVIATALTCLTGFGIFQHGGFGKPHVLGIVTLVFLAIAFAAERWRAFGGASRYVQVAMYSFTVFFHVIPGFTETSTRLPAGAPLASGPDDPHLQMAIGIAFLVFLVGLALQLARVRRERGGTLGAAVAARAD